MSALCCQQLCFATVLQKIDQIFFVMLTSSYRNVLDTAVKMEQELTCPTEVPQHVTICSYKQIKSTTFHSLIKTRKFWHFVVVYKE